MYVMELKDLLSDLRVYLGETLAREKLCTTAEEQRQRLLARLGGQPPPITTSTTNTPTIITCGIGVGYIGTKNSSPSPPPAYIDMSRSSTLTSTINSSKSDLNCYELMSDCSPATHNKQMPTSAAAATPAAPASTQSSTTTMNSNGSSKSGRLGRRERFLFVGQTKKCWACLLTVPQPQLNLFAHQGDPKAHTMLQLDGYQARPLANLAIAAAAAAATINGGTNKTESNPKLNNNQLTTFEIFCPGKKTYQFSAETAAEMLSWVEAINDACLRHKRQLPCLPQQQQQTYDVPQPPPFPHQPQELYDTPDARIRPVTPTTPSNHHLQQEYERMHDSLYHIIDDKRRPKQEQLYKNVGLEDEDDDETCYYNLVPRAAEDIYQTITETEKCITSVNNTNNTINTNTNNNNNNINNRTAPQNRIQAIIQAMEASIAEAQLYEPVDTSQELSR